MSSISGKQRVLNSINHISSDRVSITFDAEKEVYSALYDYFDSTSKEKLFDALHVDTWMILPGNFIFPSDEICETEKTSIWGYKSRVSEYSGGTYDEIYYNPLSGKDDIKEIKNHNWPSSNILDFSHFPKEAQDHKDRAVIGVFTWGAFHIAALVRGMEDLMIDFALNHEYVDYLINTISDISISALDNMLENYGDGIDIIYMADDYCSQLGPLFGLDKFEKFVMPYLRKVVEITHEKNKKFLLHCCGAVRPLLPMIIDAGVDMLEPLQTSAKGMIPEELKKEFGADLCFYGGVDTQQLLCNGTRDEVANEVRKLIDILAKDGGYIIGPSHTYIQPDVPIGNIISMYETANSYGIRC